MAEYRDVYTRDGCPTGRVWRQGTPRTPGDYYPHAIVILRTAEGLYPLAQRALDSRYFPGEWDVTGGGVDHGETPLEGGIREVREELGVTVPPERCRLIHRYRLDYENGTGSHVYVFGAVIDPPEAYDIDRKEVNAVREVPFDAFLRAVMYNKDEDFARALTAFEAECAKGGETK